MLRKASRLSLLSAAKPIPAVRPALLQTAVADDSTRRIHSGIASSSHHDDALAHPYLAYVSKNSKIPAFLKRLNEQDKKIIELKSAIQHGNSDAAIFSDPDCYLYVMYLQKTGSISTEEATTLHVYLMALMQFTDKQPLKEKDADLKSLREVHVIRLVQSGKITEFGVRYINQLITACRGLVKLDADEIAQYLISLPATEQWLLQIQNPAGELHKERRDDGFYSADQLKTVLYQNVPFIGSIPEVIDVRKPAASIIVPSTSIIKFVLGKISPAPLQMLPIYGRIKTETLLKLHEQNIHPVAFYSPHVKSNLDTVHSYRGGPFFNWMHDIGHVLWGSMLAVNDRNVLYKVIIPVLKRMQSMAAAESDAAVVKIIGQKIEGLNDFDLSPLQSYLHPSNRFINYLKVHADSAVVRPKRGFFDRNVMKEEDKRIYQYLINALKDFQISEHDINYFKLVIKFAAGAEYGRRDEIDQSSPFLQTVNEILFGKRR